MLKQVAFALVIAFSINPSMAIDSQKKPHKIAYLFSPPRSLSVTFMRMMEAYGFTVFQEPSLATHDAEQFPEWFIPTAPKTYSAVKALIAKAAESNDVFVKEMAVSAKNFLAHEAEIVTDPNMFSIFLIRNPHHAIISLYKKYNGIGDLPAYECGYQATYELFIALQEKAKNKPLVIASEDLYEHPEETAKKICVHLKIPFKPSMLQWKDLGEDFTGHEQWHETKHKETTHHWHSDAIRSSGIKTPSTYEVDESGNPTFSEVAAEHRQKVIAVYHENKRYYDLLKKNAGTSHK